MYILIWKMLKIALNSRHIKLYDRECINAVNVFLCWLQTRYDFTICYGVLLILAVDIIMFGFFCTFYYSYITDIAYGCLGALLYSLVWKNIL